MKRGREDPSEVVAAVGGGSSARGGRPSRAMVATVVAPGAAVVPVTNLDETRTHTASEVVAAASDVVAAASDLVVAGEGGSGGKHGAPAVEQPKLPRWVCYAEKSPFEEYVTDEESEEDDEDVDDTKEARDAKSRHVLRQLWNGFPTCETRDGYCKECPFCTRIVHPDRNSIIQHAAGLGQSNNHHDSAAFKAKHAALGVYLKKQRAWDYSTGKEQPPLKLRIAKMNEAAAKVTA